MLVRGGAHGGVGALAAVAHIHRHGHHGDGGDGLGDGVLVEPEVANTANFDVAYLRDTSFALLQGSRMRNTKTEFVSCPSCGRTLFDLQEGGAYLG